MSNSNSSLIRWILFVPLSFIASGLVMYLMNLIGGGTLEVFFPTVGATISGMLSWGFSSATLIFIAHVVIPAHKKTAVIIYAIIWSVIILIWTVFVYYLAEKGVAGSFWYPCLMDIASLVGIWYCYSSITKTER